jgi:hypothetical protein
MSTHSCKITIRFTPAQLEDLRICAAEDERDFSDFLRLVLRRAVAARRAASEPERASA